MFGFIFGCVDGINSVGHFVLCVVLVFICVLVYVAWCCSALLVCVGRGGVGVRSGFGLCCFWFVVCWCCLLGAFIFCGLVV